MVTISWQWFLNTGIRSVPIPWTASISGPNSEASLGCTSLPFDILTTIHQWETTDNNCQQLRDTFVYVQCFSARTVILYFEWERLSKKIQWCFQDWLCKTWFPRVFGFLDPGSKTTVQENCDPYYHYNEKCAQFSIPQWKSSPKLRVKDQFNDQQKSNYYRTVC